MSVAGVRVVEFGTSEIWTFSDKLMHNHTIDLNIGSQLTYYSWDKAEKLTR